MTNKDGLSRRDFLKRSAALGGALVWVAPVVQVVGMRPAFAQTVSPGGVCDDFYAVKFEPVDDDDLSKGFNCFDIANQSPPSGNQCLDVGDMGVTPIPGPVGCTLASVSSVSGSEWVIQLAPGCDFLVGQAELKTGTEVCVDSEPFDPTNNTVTFDTSGQDISHVEIVFCKFV